jgi:hypothetical protein
VRSGECGLDIVFGCKSFLPDILRAALQRSALVVIDVIEFGVAMFDFRDGTNKLVLCLFGPGRYPLQILLQIACLHTYPKYSTEVSIDERCPEHVAKQLLCVVIKWLNRASAAKLAAIPAGASPADRGVQLLS